MTEESKTIQQFEYKAEMKQLLNLIVHSLYTHKEIFLRELISNASDALNKIRYRLLTDKDVLDAEAELAITITIDEKAQTFSISDTGTGMTQDELINNIGTVARSGTLDFLDKVKEGKDTVSEHLIGQFGVGFYSVFMVADEVTIETRHADRDSKGYRWTSKGEGNFSVEEIALDHRGTTISFKLKDEAKEFCHEYTIKSTIQKYSNFADFPINLGTERVNTVEALWRKNSQDIKDDELNEFYKFISNDFDNPLGHLQLNIEGTGANFRALLFVPKTAPVDLLRMQQEKSIHLYTNKVLIMDDCKDLLPEYLRFVKGVVDTSDLPLNVSREVVQSSPVMDKIRSILTSKILNLLKSWVNKDKEKYMTFYKSFGPLFKTGVNSDYNNRDKVIELLRFETSLRPGGELISLKEYIAGMKDKQEAIYYLSGDNRGVLESNPNLEYFKKNEIDVLLLSDPVDVFVVPTITEYDKKPLKSIDKEDIDLLPEDKVEKPEDNLSNELIALFKDTLNDKVGNVIVSKRLVDSPVTLVASKDGMDPQMEKMMKFMQRDAQFPVTKKIMEVNTSHPLIQNLSRKYIADSTDPMLARCIELLYEGAMYIDGNLPASADFIKSMFDIMKEATN